ncbi:23 kDa integral membrane protein-like [Tachysurus vachellii]|uniref:23 kDa integral membrane protein-like n=1 Tax=Tachysurus vachellii TaxID=175792 RepID=UPI00296AD4E1|nr:23 kDa integral membrane protein-like [Tachysurus vachellii]
MAKGSSFKRRLCIVLNILLGFLGVGLLLVGIVMSTFKTEPLISGYYWQDGTHSVIFSIGFGLATILLSILGVYGAYQEHVLALFLYNIFMSLEFIALLALTVISILLEPQVEKKIDESFRNMTSLYYTDEVFHRELSKLQQEAECCGLLYYGEWSNQIPSSCDCPQNYSDKEARCTKVSELNKKAGTEPTTFRYVHKMNCSLILMRHVKKALRILYGTVFTLATIMLAAVIVALFLGQKIKTHSSHTGISHNRMKYELQQHKMT